MHRSLARALVLSTALAGIALDFGVLRADGPIAPELPAAVYSRQRVFSIPFKIEQPTPGGTQPRGVQLHVSQDQGGSWRVAETIDPKSGRFNFRAERDGEYWFFVRTVDEKGELQPVGPPTPELRVVVDTLAPRLKLEQQIGEGGEITATWQILDQNLKADTFRLEFQAADASTWETVNIPQPKKADAQPVQRVVDGRVTWWPGTSTGKIRIRGGVIDLAGNPAMSQLDVDLDNRPATAVANRATPQDRLTATRRPAGNENSSRERTDRVAAYPGPTGRESRWNPDYSAREPFRPDGGDARRTDPLVNTPPADATAQAEEIPAPPPAESVPAGQVADRARDAGRRGRPVSTGNEYDSTSPVIESDEAGSWNEAESLPPPRPAQGGTGEDVRLNDPRQPSGAAASRSIQDREPPEGVAGPKYVNSLRFELEYDVEAVGSAGIGRVELWGTKDKGKTWETYGIDPDNRSPFVITVEDEGLYGFQIVVESGTGLGGLPPQSGDEAEVWVGVDLTAPTVTLSGIDQGDAERAGELTIRWEASDEFLGARPVSLAFRDARGGEWSTFASGLQNTGRHLWQIDRRVPEEIYLRVEVRDAAGNVSVADSVEPISLNRVRPQGRIRDVRPARDSLQGARDERSYWR